MKRVLAIFCLIFVYFDFISAQDDEVIFEIVSERPQYIKIAGVSAYKGKKFSITDAITWEKTPNCIWAKPVSNEVKDKKGNVIWGYNVKNKITSENVPSGSSLATVLYEETMSKGMEFSLRGKFYMLNDTLTIKVPEIFSKNQGFVFQSIKTGQKFNSRYDTEKPVVYILKKDLDSVGLTGDYIELKVTYFYYGESPQELDGLMRIKVL